MVIMNAGANRHIAAFRAVAAARRGCRLQLFPSPDPLTRLLMEADGVDESDLQALLEQIAMARPSSCGSQSQ
jgi:hypothetical protein